MLLWSRCPFPSPPLVRVIKVAHQALLNSYWGKKQQFSRLVLLPSTVTQHGESWFQTTKAQFFRETEHLRHGEKKRIKQEIQGRGELYKSPSLFMRAAQEIFLKTRRELWILDAIGWFWGGVQFDSGRPANDHRCVGGNDSMGSPDAFS